MQEAWLLCDTPIWDWDLSWNSDQPFLTPCFRYVLLSIAPCAVLWVTTILDLVFTRNQDHKCGPYPWTTLTLFKLIVTSLLIVSSVIQGIYCLYREGPQTESRDLYLSLSIKLITYVLALCLQIRQRRDGKLTSLKLALFWNLMTPCEFLSSPLYELVTNTFSKRMDEMQFTMGTIIFCLVISEAIMSHFTDPQYNMFFVDPKNDEYLIDHQAPLPRLLFTWLNRLMWYGYKNILSIEDLDALRPDVRTSHVCNLFLDSWSKEVDKSKIKKSSASLCLALIRVTWSWMLLAACLELSYDFLTLVPPIVLDWLISFINNTEEPFWHGPVYALLLFGAAASSNLLMVHNQNFLIRASVNPRSGLNAAIYRKVFQLSLESRRRYTLGELCNLVSVDTQRIFELVWSVNLLWSNPLRIALTVALLWRYLGPACLVGVATLIIIMPVTALLAVRTHQIQRSQMELKDARLRIMNEILNGIKVLKLFAWEPPFLRKVEVVREEETKSLRKLAFLNSIVNFVWILTPFMVALCSFVTFVLLDESNVLDPATAFVSLTLFGKLKGAMSSVPQIIMEVVRSRIAFRRIVEFLLSEELDVTDKEEEVTSPGNILELENCSFGWGGESKPFLQNINLTVRAGDLVAVVGRVGSGKSALISAIIGEMARTEGTIRIRKDVRVALVPQIAWIQNATLRQNVLFVSPMDKRRYDSVIKKSCLKPDLKILPGGDHTEIGEKGVNLSGGQKQRVNLARALYNDADLYLMDDPMSAVDAHVASRIFEDVIGPKGMLDQKTRILVTHDLSILPRCDTIILLSEGRIIESGTYQELMISTNGELSRMINEIIKDRQSASPQTPDSSTPTTDERGFFQRTISAKEGTLPKGARLIDSERMEVGRVQTGVYCSYFRSAGFAIIFFMFAGYASHQAFEIGSNVWLSFWSMDLPLPDGSQDISLRNLRMSVYGGLGLAQGVCILSGALLLACASTRASIRLHKSMLWSVIRSPLSFFETTPLGRIINRFGKDIDCVDIAVPAALSNVTGIVVSAAGILIVICVNHPIFLLIMVPIVILYIFFQLFYVATSRQLRRLQSVSLSPVLSFFSESVQGISTLHAYGCRPFFTDAYDSLVDANCKVFLNTTFVNRWLGVHLELTGAVIVLIVALLSVFNRFDYSAAVVGLTLSYALNVTDVLRIMVRLMTQLETRMVSVERIDEYSKLEEEGSWSTECHISLTNWPREGSIVFKGYKMRYRSDAELILKGIDLEIPGGQKVGLVGRTGAGKTSLAQALFRVVEPCSGQLLIDGLDIAMLGLHDLRAKITIIPQDPVLFGGDLRFNLDPTEQYLDQEVQEALRLAHLDNLDLCTRLDEGGSNLSVGQRQQVCLARALLRKSKILVLDEATAAIDSETDRLIQETLRTQFKTCTLLTVAHRLHTLMDYDRILVIDNGRVAEDGPLDTLLKKKNSLFRELARSAGILTHLQPS